MTGYAILRLVHVAFGVLGAGTVAALAIVALVGRRAPQVLPALPALATWTSASLAVMLATGIWLDLEMRGVYHVALWFRASAIGLVITGALLGVTRRQLARVRRGALAPDRALARVAGLAIAATVIVLAIVVLMERRPS